MTIKAVAAASLLSFGVLLSAVPSMAAAPAGTDDYENGIATVRQELADNYLLGVRRRERVEINLHMAEWLHKQGKEAEALSYLNYAIGEARQPA